MSGGLGAWRLAALGGFLLLLSSPISAPAGDADPFAAMTAAGEAFQKEGLDAAIAILRKAIDDTRVDGKAVPAMAPAFGMLADAVRNSGDAAEALSLADEGLALAADPAADPLAATMLAISRAYALGDLARYAEAVAAAEAALPPYIEAFGSDAAAARSKPKRRAGSRHDGTSLPTRRPRHGPRPTGSRPPARRGGRSPLCRCVVTSSASTKRPADFRKAWPLRLPRWHRARRPPASSPRRVKRRCAPSAWSMR